MELQTADPLDVVIANFSQLEEELSACMRYVPFSAENVGCPPPDMPAETRLFVSPIHGDFASWDTDPPTIDSAWEFSWRVKFHIWDHQDA